MTKCVPAVTVLPPAASVSALRAPHVLRSEPPRRRGSPEYGDHRGGGGGGAHSPPRTRRFSPPPMHGHDQPPPPPHRGGWRDGRRGGEHSGRDSGPLSFKRFLLSEVPDDATPLQAQAMYEAYLAAHYGDSLRARFEQERTQEAVRARHHPAAYEASLARHMADAADAARALAADIRAGTLDPAAPGFNQGSGDAADDAPRAAMPCLWLPERVATDVAAAARLVALLDQQRGLTLADNPLLPQPTEGAPATAPPDAVHSGALDGDRDGALVADADADAGAPAAADGEGGNTDGGKGNGAGPAEGQEQQGDSGAVLTAVLAALASDPPVPPPSGDEAGLSSLLGRLDLLLSWLWAVHGVDYYAGRELLGEEEYATRRPGGRTLRAPQPEEGEGQGVEQGACSGAGQSGQGGRVSWWMGGWV